MLKVMAVLRTVFLVGIFGYMLWALPLGILVSGNATREAVSIGAWFAIGWIALETILGWSRVWLADRKAAKAKAAAAAPPAP